MDDILKPLSRWIALYGQAPYLDVFNPVPETKRLFCKPIFWWSLLIFILQLAQGLGMIVYESLGYQQGLFEDFPKPIVATALTMAGFFLVVNVTSRLPFIQPMKLASFLQKLRYFDELMENHKEILNRETAKLRPQLRRSLIMGGLWVLLSGGLAIVTHINSVTEKRTDLLVLIALIGIGQVFGFIHIILTFTLFYISNLGIAQRLKTLIEVFHVLVPVHGSCTNRYLKETSRRKVFVASTATGSLYRKKLSRIEFFEQSDIMKEGFQTLYEASAHFNEIYSLTVLIFLSCRLFMCSITLYSIIYIVIAPISRDSLMLLTFSAILFLSDLGFFLVILSSADRPVQQWTNLLTRVSQCRTVLLSEEEKIEIILFEQQIRNCSFAFFAGGMFNVGKHLIPGISASVLTYIIVLLQSSTFTSTS